MRSPQIYAFLLNFARDGGVNPFAPEKRLGHDRSDVRFAPDMEGNLFAVNYREDRMLENALKHFMKGNDLEEADAQVLLYLKLAGGIATLPEIRNYTELGTRTLTLSVQRLQRRKLVERVKTVPAAEEDPKTYEDSDSTWDGFSISRIYVSVRCKICFEICATVSPPGPQIS